MSDNVDVIIYKPTKSAMQSGLATNKFWILKYISYIFTKIPFLKKVLRNHIFRIVCFKFLHEKYQIIGINNINFEKKE